MSAGQQMDRPIDKTRVNKIGLAADYRLCCVTAGSWKEGSREAGNGVFNRSIIVCKIAASDH